MASQETMAQLLVPHILPEYCYVELFINLNFIHGECLRILLSKCLGFGIILGSVLVKLPQVLKIVRAGSARGLSATSNLLELAAVTATLAYGIRHRFPFSSYGEALFLILQTAVIIALILYHSPHDGASGGSSGASGGSDGASGGSGSGGSGGRAPGRALLFLAGYGALLILVCSPRLLPTAAITGLQAANIPLVVGGKSLQAYHNWRQGSTGQLSAVTVFLLTAGSLARIFTSQQETGDAVMVVTYVLASAVNLLLSAQIIRYWNVTAHGVGVGVPRDTARGGMPQDTARGMPRDTAQDTTHRQREVKKDR